MAAEAVDLESLLERLHDRCVARNLRAAGLGGINTVEEEKIYGRLDPNMRMANGDPVLHATIDFCANPQLQVVRSRPACQVQQPTVDLTGEICGDVAGRGS